MATTADTPTEARYQPPELRRQQILDAAAQLATTNGLEDTSIAKVAEAAGVAKGSIYLHFESRDDLITALQAQVWAQMMETPRVIASTDELPWAERLDAIVEHWMRYEFDHHELYHAVFHTVATQTHEPWQEARTLLNRLIAGGTEAGEFHPGNLNTEVVVEFLLHGYIGPCFHHTDIAAAITDVQQLFRRTIGAVP